MKTNPSPICLDLETCLYQAITTYFADDQTQTQVSAKPDERMDLIIMIEEWIATLQASQNQNTLDGIAYRVGQSFFYTYLYCFDAQLKFSDLSFKLQSFQKKKNYFFSSFAQQLKESTMKSEWDAEKNRLEIQTSFAHTEIAEWFLKGMFAEVLFWLSNGKQNHIQIETSQSAQLHNFQLSILEW